MLLPPLLLLLLLLLCSVLPASAGTRVSEVYGMDLLLAAGVGVGCARVDGMESSGACAPTHTHLDA